MYFTSKERVDGFGAQFQTFIYMIYYAAVNNGEYIHVPIKTMDHNYLNDPLYISSLEEFMCVKMFKCINDTNITTKHIQYISFNESRILFESSIDDAMVHISFILYKYAFWRSIPLTQYYNNNKFNIAIHIRRGDVQATNEESFRYTSNDFYLGKIRMLTETYKNKDILFHIYSEGCADEFACFKMDNCILHLNEDVKFTFIGLITADVLIQAKSSFSYVAGLLSHGIVYYIPFWHIPSSSWILL